MCSDNDCECEYIHGTADCVGNDGNDDDYSTDERLFTVQRFPGFVGRQASDLSVAFSWTLDRLEIDGSGHLTSATNGYFRSSILVTSDVLGLSSAGRLGREFDTVTTREISQGNRHVVSTFSSQSSINNVRALSQENLRRELTGSALEIDKISFISRRSLRLVLVNELSKNCQAMRQRVVN